MCKYVSSQLCVAFALLLMLGASPTSRGRGTPRASFPQCLSPATKQKLPRSAWTLLNAAQGIRVGGARGDVVNIQIIFDPNCPYCARLYKRLTTNHPGLVTRWIPIAYLLKDSGHLGAAMLESKDPAGSLRTDFLNYHFDFKNSHGGYSPLQNLPKALPSSNQNLEALWKRWGGVTPMIIYRTSAGDITCLSGASRNVIQQLIHDTNAPMPSYRR